MCVTYPECHEHAECYETFNAVHVDLERQQQHDTSRGPSSQCDNQQKTEWLLQRLSPSL